MNIGNVPGGGVQVKMSDRNENNIPDGIEMLVQSGRMPPEVAEKALEDMGIPKETIAEYMESLPPTGGGGSPAAGSPASGKFAF